MNEELEKIMVETKKCLDDGCDVKIFDYIPKKKYNFIFYKGNTLETIVFKISYNDINSFITMFAPDGKQIVEKWNELNKQRSEICKEMIKILYVGFEALKNKEAK